MVEASVRTKAVVKVDVTSRTEQPRAVDASSVGGGPGVEVKVTICVIPGEDCSRYGIGSGAVLGEAENQMSFEYR